jgi:hypothetical protein
MSAPGDPTASPSYVRFALFATDFDAARRAPLGATKRRTRTTRPVGRYLSEADKSGHGAASQSAALDPEATRRRRDSAAQQARAAR